jgi:hypothetical protein
VEEEEDAGLVEEAALGFGMVAAVIVQQNYLGRTFSFSKYVVLL